MLTRDVDKFWLKGSNFCLNEFSCDSPKLKRLRRNLLIGMSKQALTLHLQSIKARYMLFPKCLLQCELLC